MRIVVAPDKFKGTLTASAAAAAIAEGLMQAASGVDVAVVPVADGGDGTLDAVVAAGAELGWTTARDPLGRPVEVPFALLGEVAVVESAQVGLTTLAPHELDPLHASSLGVGDLLGAARETRPSEVIVGVGGSAWTDGGAGMATALGWRLIDRRGRELASGGAALADLERIESPPSFGVAVRALCDVDHSLLGPRGAARVFAPQKGAAPREVAVLESGLARLAAIAGGDPLAARTGAGGGLGFGLRSFLDAALLPGFDALADLVGFDEAVRGADLVVTGEGRLDETSLGGKAPVAVARRAARLDVPCAVLAGSVDLSVDDLRAVGFAAALSLTERFGAPAEGDPTTALADAARLLLEGWGRGGAGILPST